MKRKLSIFFWAIVSLLGAVAAVPPPIQYTPMTTNAPAGMTNAIRNIASTLSRDLNANNKQITNAYLVGSQLVIASNLTAGNILLVTGPSYLSGTAYGGTIVGTNFVGNGAGLTNVTASATNAQPVLTPEQFGAVGNGVADDTAAMKSCFGAASADGALTRTVLLGAGKTYSIGDAIQITNAGVVVQGSVGIDIGGTNIASTIWQTNAANNGIEYLFSSGAEQARFGRFDGFRVLGSSGSANTNTAGIVAGVVNTGSGYLMGMSKFDQLDISGFGNGVILSNAFGCAFDSCVLMSNRLSSIRLEKCNGDIAIRNCHIGWSQETNGVALYIPAENPGGPVHVNGYGGDMGVCKSWIHANAGFVSWYGGNVEQCTGSAVVFSNCSSLRIYGTRMTATGVNVTNPVFKIFYADPNTIWLSPKVEGYTDDLCHIYERYGTASFPYCTGTTTATTNKLFSSDVLYQSENLGYKGNIPVLGEGNIWGGNQTLASGKEFIGILHGDGSQITNLSPAGISLYPYTNTVWFENGIQGGFVVGANAGASIVSTNTEKDFYLVAPNYTYDGFGTNDLVGLMQYIATTNDVHYIRYGWAQGYGSVQQHIFYVNGTNSETPDIGTTVAAFQSDGTHFLLPAQFKGRDESTNLYFMLTNTGFISEHDWLTNPVLHVVSPYNPVVTVIYTNGVGDTNTTIVYTNQNTVKIDGDLVIGGGEYSLANATIYGSGFGLTNLNIGNANLFPNAFSGWVTNVAPSGTNRIMYTNGIVWTNIFE